MRLRTGISDFKLGLKPRWFTGKEWADGTAERENWLEFGRANSDYRRAHSHTNKTGEDGKLAEIIARKA